MKGVGRTIEETDLRPSVKEELLNPNGIASNSTLLWNTVGSTE